jgi:aromatic amino acid aminotransferase I
LWNSVGQNPTGGTLSLERRKKIYATCQKYDVMIVEDDPYYFLQMPDYGSENNRYPASEIEFLDSLIPSYLRIDVDGRVLRCDSFSKVIAPGSRAGWITAAPIFIERLTRHAEVGTQATSGWAQSFIAKLLVDEWKMSGWIEWLKGLGFEYTKRRDYIVGAMNEEFDVSPASTEEGDYVVLSRGKSLISFVPPMAGMFLWIRVALEEHHRYDGENAVELMDELWKRIAVKEDLLIAPGRMFAAGDEQREEAAKYFRVAFSVGEKKEVDEMVKRFGRAVRWFFKGKT